MKLINSQNVYTFVLTELEWYAATEQQREAWVNQILREAAEYRCQYASIMVEPDAVMSISPIDKRHKVWGHTFPSDNEYAFKAELLHLWRANIHELTETRMRALAKEVFGE